MSYSMKSGFVFDIREFSIHDGPGLRTTVFLKGCPLRCTWCHNPEGQSLIPLTLKSPAGERLAGKEYSPTELAKILNSQAKIFWLNEGGVTFSGGEPLMQAEFVIEVIELLEDIHVLVDTSGYGDKADFVRLISRCDLVYFDLKIIDTTLFRAYTGGDIRIVMNNLKALSETGVPYVIRIPLVPGVTDTQENLANIASKVGALPNLLRVDLLPYNRLAEAKYEAAGINFQPGFDEAAELNLRPLAFENLRVPWRVV